MTRTIHTVLSFGLNRVVEHLRGRPDLRRFLIAALIANELRGAIMAWEIGKAVL